MAPESDNQDISDLDIAQIRTLWSLDPKITFLNHGSFGACPVPVLEQQRSLRAQLEREPVDFFVHALEPLVDEARQTLASFVGANPDSLAFIPNATTGISTVLRSLTFQPEDELLTTSHEYNASRNALDFVAQRAGARVVVADLPFPIQSADQVVEAVLKQVSSRTRLLLIDHITSQTGLILPIEALVQKLAVHGIEVLVDGAHAPGMIPLQLDALGVAYYTGNCHKWLCAPKGAAFLYVRPDRQDLIRPLVISHGANSPRRDRSRFHLEFDWLGTLDPTPYLCVPAAIQFLGGLLPGGWPELMQHNHQTVLKARQKLCEALQLITPSPAEMTGSMAVLPLPEQFSDSRLPASRLPTSLQNLLFDRFQIQVPVIPSPTSEQQLLRISAQIYNTSEDYDDLARALVEIYAE